jgi:hypothetical protein
MLTFWALFAALGARWSIDARRVMAGAGASHVSIGAAALLLQPVLVYLFSGLMKLAWSPVWLDGTAIARALALESLATPLGLTLGGHPGLLSAATYAVLALELLGPIALLLPLKTVRLRLCALGVLILFHVGSALALELGLFPLVCVAGLLPFVPGVVWDRLARATTLPGKAATSPLDDGWPRRALQLACAAALAYVVAANVASLFASSPLPFVIDRVGAALRLKQSWAMFAGNPDEVRDGWYAVRGTTPAGAELDLNRGGAPFTLTKPAVISENHESMRWGAFMESAIAAPAIRDSTLAFHCRRFNANRAPEVRAVRVELLFVAIDGGSISSAERLAERTCSDEAP